MIEPYITAIAFHRPGSGVVMTLGACIVAAYDEQNAKQQAIRVMQDIFGEAPYLQPVADVMNKPILIRHGAHGQLYVCTVNITPISEADAKALIADNAVKKGSIE